MSLVGSILPRHFKSALKARLRQWRAAYVRGFHSYEAHALLGALRRLGLQPGDSVMLHSAFSSEHGFRGQAQDLIDTFMRVVSPGGHLLMVTLPYRDAALDWLARGRRFDVARTPSMMGLVSEMFRRRPDVRRSLHPTHPVAVWGPQAEAFVAAHPDCPYPCGPGTPFDELARHDGKAVFFNVPIDTFTFFHHLEHLVAPSLPFALYTDEIFEVPTVDAQGHERIVRTHAFTREAIRRRRPERLYDALREGGLVAEQRIGATRLLCVRVRDAIECTRKLQAEGRLFYDMTPAT